MSNSPRLTVVGGTDTGQRAVVDSAPTSRLVATGLFDADGNPYYKGMGASGGGDGGGEDTVKPIWKLDIPRDVQIVKWGLAALTTVFGLAFWFTLGQIDSRFDRADEKIGEISQQVADVRVGIAQQSGDVKAILEKLDDQSQGSSRERQSETVHQGTEGGKGKP